MIEVEQYRAEIERRLNEKIADMESRAATLYDLSNTYRSEGNLPQAERVERQANEIASQACGLAEMRVILAAIDNA